MSNPLTAEEIAALFPENGIALDTERVQEIIDLATVWPHWRAFKIPELDRPEGTLVIAGAYQGKLMELMARVLPQTRIIGYEPAPWAFERAQARTKDFPNCTVIPYAIGTKEGVFPMGEWGTDGCSFVNMSREQGEGEMLHFLNAFFAAGIVDASGMPLDKPHHLAFILNMEGYEFELVPALLHAGCLGLMAAIQWHVGVGARERMGYLPTLLDRNGYMLLINEWPAWTIHLNDNEREIDLDEPGSFPAYPGGVLTPWEWTFNASQPAGFADNVSRETLPDARRPLADEAMPWE